jgi:hypothetical protein
MIVIFMKRTLTEDSSDGLTGTRRSICTKIGSDADWNTPIASSCDDLDTSTPLTCE